MLHMFMNAEEDIWGRIIISLLLIIAIITARHALLILQEIFS